MGEATLGNAKESYVAWKSLETRSCPPSPLFLLDLSGCDADRLWILAQLVADK